MNRDTMSQYLDPALINSNIGSNNNVPQGSHLNAQLRMNVGSVVERSKSRGGSRQSNVRG